MKRFLYKYKKTVLPLIELANSKIMDSPLDEISIEIFRQVRFPSALSRTNRHWARISKDAHAKAAWLISQHGKAHSLFHIFIQKPVLPLIELSSR